MQLALLLLISTSKFNGSGNTDLSLQKLWARLCPYTLGHSIVLIQGTCVHISLPWNIHNQLSARDHLLYNTVQSLYSGFLWVTIS